MKAIGLISCTKKKLQVAQATPARELYSASRNFRLALAHCQRVYDQTFVLSALHGLVELDQIIEPYDLTLAKMTAREREKWSHTVHERLGELELRCEKFFFHAGEKYREFLINWLPDAHEPLVGLSIGHHPRWYGMRDTSNPERDFLHASGEVACYICGKPYWKHKADPVHPFMKLLCDGLRVKL